VFFSALLFAALLEGTTFGLTGNVIQPELATWLTYVILGLIVLFVGAELLIVYAWTTGRKLGRRRPEQASTAKAAA